MPVSIVSICASEEPALVMRAGEVPLAQAIYHTTDTPVIHYIEHSHDNTYPVVDEIRH